MLTLGQSLFNLLVFITFSITGLYLLRRHKTFIDFLMAKKPGIKGQIVVIIVAGILIILASQYAVDVAGARVNVRDCIAIFAGMLGGPVAGISVGLIGGIYRMSLGGWTAIPCGLATIVAGFIGAWLYEPRWRKIMIPAVAIGIGFAGGIYRYSIGMEWWGAAICVLFVMFAGFLCIKSAKEGYRIKALTTRQIGTVALITGIWEFIHINIFCPFLGGKATVEAFSILTTHFLFPMTTINVLGILTFLFVCREATIVRQQALKLKQSHDELEQRVEERTKQLALFSQSVDSSIDGVGIGGLDRRITYVNDAFVSMFGYTKEELIGQRIATIYAEDQIPKLEEEVLPVTVDEGGWTGELIGRRKNGELFPMMVSASRVEDDEGNVIAMMATHRDISELKCVEDSLQEVQERLAVTLKSIGDGVIAIDTDGRVTLMNDMAQELTGWKIDEAAERPLHEILNIVNEETRNPIDDPIVKVLHSGNVVGLGNHSVLIAKDGTERAIADSGAPITAFDGTTIGVVLVFRDVTERRKVEEERKALVEKLSEANRTLEERAKSLEEAGSATLNMAYDLDAALIEAAKSNDKLEELTRKLERSNKDLQDFVYIVSHDLKAPVRRISAFGDLLKESLEGKLDEDEQENFEFMIDGAARMQQLINDLLLYSRVSTKAKPMARVDLNDVVEDLRNVELATELEEVGGVIEVPEPLPAVHADPSQMHQLLQNLIGNGLKYYRDGVSPVVTIRGKTEGNEVRIEIKDNGIGISDAHFEKIFMMFQRLHTDDRGTGVGLAVCKRIVGRHGGEIGVESTPGEGSTFWFTIPDGR